VLGGATPAPSAPTALGEATITVPLTPVCHLNVKHHRGATDCPRDDSATS